MAKRTREKKSPTKPASFAEVAVDEVNRGFNLLAGMLNALALDKYDVALKADPLPEEPRGTFCVIQHATREALWALKDRQPNFALRSDQIPHWRPWSLGRLDGVANATVGFGDDFDSLYKLVEQTVAYRPKWMAHDWERNVAKPAQEHVRQCRDLLLLEPRLEVPTPLTESQQQAFDYIEERGPVMGKEIVSALGLSGLSAFTTHYVPRLKEHGVKNQPGVGYYLEPDKRAR